MLRFVGMIARGLATVALFAGATGVAQAQSQATNYASVVAGPREPQFLLDMGSAKRVPIDITRTPALTRRISVDLNGVGMRQALAEVAERGGIRLMYADGIVPVNTTVRLRAESITIAAALTDLLVDSGVDVVFTRTGEATLVKRPVPPEPGIVTGRVTDARSGAPLGSVMVTVRGTQLGSSSGDDGSFRIVRVPPGTHTIIARRIGYNPVSKTVTVTDGGTVTVDFALEVSATNLEAVVVTGTAGNQTREAQSAVVASIDAADLVQKAPVTNVNQVLEGRVPGVVVVPASGTVGASSRINIRGAASIQLSNDPLVFIDGVRMGSGQRFLPGISSPSGIGGQALSSINDLNPDDIESIEVVKGPAAATLYGADASAGVIQIITKKGRMGANHVSQNVSLEYDNIQPNFTPDPNWGTCTASDVAPGSGSALCEGKAAGTVVSDNPLVREDAFRNGNLKSLNYSAQGGTDVSSFYLSGIASTETGTTRNSYLIRRDGRANFTWAATPKFNVEGNLGLSRNDYKLPNGDQSIGGYMIISALTGAPTTVTRDANGNLTGGWALSVPILAGITSESNTMRYTPSVQAKYSPFSWMTNRLTVGGDLANSDGLSFYPKTGAPFLQPFSNGYVISTKSTTNVYTVDYLGNARTTFFGNKDIISDFSVGSQFINTVNEALTGNATGGLLTNSSNLISSSPVTTAEEGYGQQKSLGFFAQEQLAFGDRLFVQVATRVDRNSAFGTDASAFVLPKAGVSYVISKEGFWKGIAPVISSLRLRAAYGTTGRSPAPAASLQTYGQFSYVNPNNGSLNPGVTPANPGNQNLKPERGKEFETGFEAGFFNERAGLDVTYYNKKTSDLLLLQPIAPSLGFTQNPYINAGEALNRGFEFTLRATPIDHENFNWDANFTGSTLHNELVSLGTLAPLTRSSNGVATNYVPGKPMASLYTYKITGYDASTGTATVTDAPVFVGTQMPTFTGNFNTTFTLFRNLRIYAMFNMQHGAKIFNFTELFNDQFLGTGRGQIPVGQPGSYTAEEYARRFGPFVTASGTPVGASVVRDAYVQSSDFVRFQELSATLSLPSRLAQSLHASGASITVGGRNLHLWKSDDYTGWDPEVITNIGTGTRQLDASTLYTTPPVRRWIARLNLQF